MKETPKLNQLIYSQINEDFERKHNIEPTYVWYPDFSRKDITDTSEMFKDANLNGIDFSHWKTSNVTNMSDMLKEAQNIPESIRLKYQTYPF